jgi:uncharacterized protein (TIGR02117 family)
VSVRAALVALALALVGCSGATRDRPIAPPGPAELAKLVWVVSHGWHVGLAMRRTDVRADVWSEASELGDLDHVEVGWGDGAFYPAPRGTVGLALRAAVASEGSVLHVAGFDGPVAAFFSRSPIVELRVTPAGFDALCRFIAAAYARDAGGRPVTMARGLYGDSRFYAARERYHLFANSNQWAARALRAAGVPVRTSLFARGVMAQVETLGVVLRAGP